MYVFTTNYSDIIATLQCYVAFGEGGATMMDSNTLDKGAHRWLIQKLKIRQILTDFECLYYKLPWRYDVYVAFGEGGATMMDSNTYF